MKTRVAVHRGVVWTIGGTALCGLLFSVWLQSHKQSAPLASTAPRLPRLETSPPRHESHDKPMGTNNRKQQVPEVDKRQVAEWFRKVISSHRQSMSEPSHGVKNRFAREARFKLVELRLLSLAFPEWMKHEALTLAQDDAAQLLDRFAAFYVLGVLSRNGEKEAEAVLAHLSRSKDVGIASEALRRLSESDDAGAHRALYRERALAGDPLAFRALSFWSDGSSIQALREYIGSSPTGTQQPAYELRLAAEDALNKISLLSTTAGQHQVLLILEDPTKDSKNTPWASRAASTSNLLGATQAMRKRLDTVIMKTKEEFDTVRKESGESIEASDYSKEFSTSTTLFNRIDPAFDDVLEGYAKMGGALNALEAARLRHFGYMCDPLERVHQVLTGKP